MKKGQNTLNQMKEFYKHIIAYKKIEAGVKKILEGLRIDWQNNDNFKETPKRVAKAFIEFNNGLFSEYDNVKIFNSRYKGIIFFKDIKSIGLCPHHLLPIEYSIIFAYIPTGKVLGLSKVPRVIKNLCQRPVLQEDLTNDIVDYFKRKLHPLGIAVVVKGVHGCMKYRGIKELSEVKTAELYGDFMKEPEARNEFYQLIKQA
jgi:GTP cyclohydrolase I